MPLHLGARLGPYEVITLIGAGGMGEVYKARDTRLGRMVAIKILRSPNPDLKQRFEREAKAIGALSHPHICTLYDVGSEDGMDYLVMEYLDGHTLSDRLHKGALPVGEALQYAIEVAGALERAHRAGFTHRDLKPGNIMLTKRGATLLDFGLAKLRTSRPQITAENTVTMRNAPLTQEGILLGTLPYMAPEQLEGKEVDPRTDVWAFGCVLYEMISGSRAFEGKSQANLIGAIMHGEVRPLCRIAATHTGGPRARSQALRR